MLRKTSLLIFVWVVALSACTPANSISPDSIPARATPTEQFSAIVSVFESTQTPIAYPTPEGDEDECDNPFYPVADEATWFYSHSDGTNSISTMSADDFGKFTITAEGSDSKFTIDGECTPDGIVIMNAPGAMTTYTGDDGGSTVATVTSDGVSIPKDIGQGAQWAQTITVTTEAGISVIDTNYTAVGFENITVPAGDFYALKVEQSGYVTVFGQKVNMHGFTWYAEGVGVVKSVWDGAPAVELTMYDIPD